MIKRFVSGALLSMVMDKEARKKLARIKVAQPPNSGNSGDSGAKPAARTPPAKTAKAVEARAPGHMEDAPRNVRVRSPALARTFADDDDGPLLGDLLGPGAGGGAKGGKNSGGDEDPLALIESAVAAARQSLGMDAPRGPAAKKRPAKKFPAESRPAAAKAAPNTVEPKKTAPERPVPKKAASKKAAKAAKAAPKAAPKGGRPRGHAPDPGAPGSEREQLIANALSIHAEKSRLLDELAPDLKDKLRLIALKQLDPQAFEEIKRDALERHKKRTTG